MTKLVLLPGMHGTDELFAPLIAQFTRQVPTCEIEIISYPRACISGYKDLIAFVRTRLPREDYFLLGESFSGPIAISIAATNPEGLRGLILSCTFATNPRPALAWLEPLLSPAAFRILKTAPDKIKAYLLMGKYGNANLHKTLSSALAAIPAATLGSRTAAVLTLNVEPRLAEIKIPVLSLSAKQDMLVSGMATARMQHDIQLLEAMQFDGPHMLLQCAPEKSAEAINTFMRKHENLAT